MAFVAVRSFSLLAFLGLVATSFRAAAALFGPVLFSFGFGSRRGFWNSNWGAAFDAKLEIGHNVGVQTEFDFVIAQRADGMLEVNFALIERDVELGLELVGDHAGRNRAEHLAILAGLDGDNTGELG